MTERLFSVLIAGVRGNDVQNLGGIWTAKTASEALGLAAARLAERWPSHPVTGEPLVMDITDLVRAWVAANPE